MKIKKTIAIVDDHILFRQGLLSLIKEFDELKVIFEASNGKELIEQLKLKQPDVILLDLAMPLMDGAEATSIIKQRYPEIKIIILTIHNEDGLIIDLIERGANGFLCKDSDIEIVVDAIYNVIENEHYFNDRISKTLMQKLSSTKKISPFYKTSRLTDKETEIIKLICKELTNKEIADLLCLSSRTIEVYRSKILEKTGVKNTAGIVLYAIKNKLLD